MKTEQLTDLAPFEDGIARRASHIWPVGDGYRKSGAVHAQPGDLALCGEVKVTVGYGGPNGQGMPVDCQRCLRLDMAGAG